MRRNWDRFNGEGLGWVQMGRDWDGFKWGSD